MYLKWIVLVWVTVGAVSGPAFAENGALPPDSGEAELSHPRPNPGEIRYLTLGRKKDIRYSVRVQPQTPAQKELFDSLSPEDQELFLKRQWKSIRVLARALNATRLGLGAGSVVVERLFKMLPTWRQIGNPIRTVRERFRRGENIETAHLEPGEQGKGSLSARGQRIVQAILNFVNMELWDQSPVIVRKNEYSIHLLAGGASGVGWSKGATTEADKSRSLYREFLLGAKLGWNHERQSLVISLWRDVEQMKAVFPILIRAINVGIKLGGGVAYSTAEDVGEKTIQTGQYPPGPLEVIGGPSEMSILGTLGVGLPPFNTFAYLRTHVDRLPLVHLELGLKNFILKGWLVDGVKHITGKTAKAVWAAPAAAVRGIRCALGFQRLRP